MLLSFSSVGFGVESLDQAGIKWPASGHSWIQNLLTLEQVYSEPREEQSPDHFQKASISAQEASVWIKRGDIQFSLTLPDAPQILVQPDSHIVLLSLTAIGSVEDFQSWLKRQTPPEIHDYFKNQQSWRRGDFELTVRYPQRSIDSDEPPSREHCHHEGYIRWLMKTIEHSNRFTYTYLTKDDETIYISTYEFRQYLALIFEWMLEKILNSTLLPYITRPHSENNAYIRQVPKGKKGSKQNKEKQNKPVPVESPSKKEDKLSHEKSNDKPVPKEVLTEQASPSSSSALIQAKDFVAKKQYDRAIKRLLSQIAKHNASGREDSSGTEQLLIDQLNKAIQAKFSAQVHPSIKSPYSLANLKSAYAQVQPFQLIPYFLLTSETHELIRLFMNRHVPAILDERFSRNELESSDPQVVINEVETTIYQFPRGLNENRKEYLASLWFQASGIIASLYQLIEQRNIRLAAQMLDSRMLLFDGLGPFLPQKERDHVVIVYQGIIDKMIALAEKNASPAPSDITLIKRLMYRNIEKRQIFELIADTQSLITRYERLISHLDHPDSATLTLNVVPVPVTVQLPPSPTVTFEQMSVEALVAKSGQQIEEADNPSLALGIIIALLNQNQIPLSTIMQRVLINNLQLLLTPLLYDLALISNRPQQFQKWLETFDHLYRSLEHLKTHLPIAMQMLLELIARKSPLTSGATASLLGAALPTTLPPPDQLSDIPEDVPEASEENNEGFTVVNTQKKKPKTKEKHKAEKKGMTGQTATTTLKQSRKTDFWRRFEVGHSEENSSSRLLRRYNFSPTSTNGSDKLKTIPFEAKPQKKGFQPGATYTPLVAETNPLHDFISKAFKLYLDDNAPYDERLIFIDDLVNADLSSLAFSFLMALSSGDIKASESSIKYLLTLNHHQLDKTMEDALKYGEILTHWGQRK